MYLKNHSFTLFFSCLCCKYYCHEVKNSLSKVYCHWQTSLMYLRASLPTSLLGTSPTSWPRITEVTRSQMASACLWFLERGQIKTQPAAHLLNVEETHTAAIPDDDRRGASIPDPCSVNGADLAQMTPMEHIMRHLNIFSILMNRIHL